MRSSGSRADEAYERWTEFTRTASQARGEKNAKHRSEVLERREEQIRAAEMEVESKKAALVQRMTEANERRLAHIDMLLQQARIASERAAAVQQAREARRMTWSDEMERSGDRRQRERRRRRLHAARTDGARRRQPAEARRRARLRRRAARSRATRAAPSRRGRSGRRARPT